MIKKTKANSALYIGLIGVASWILPGGGYFLMNQKKRAAIIFITIVLTFAAGMYAGSIGVVDRVPAKIWSWYTAQMMVSPAVALIGNITAPGNYPVYGKPAEIGQIYTGMAGLLNLLCIVNEIYAAYLLEPEKSGK